MEKLITKLTKTLTSENMKTQLVLSQNKLYKYRICLHGAAI